LQRYFDKLLAYFGWSNSNSHDAGAYPIESVAMCTIPHPVADYESTTDVGTAKFNNIHRFSCESRGPLAYMSKVQSTLSSSSTQAKVIAAVMAARVNKNL
jgi:hypothetical protein